MLFQALVFAAAVSGHAVMQTPEPRRTGPTQEALCGAAVTKRLENDRAGPIENAMEYADEDYKCDAYLCRGYQLEDNLDNVQVFSAGDELTVHIDLIAGHRPGYANISVIDLELNQIIGEPLKSWDDWLSRDPNVPDDELDFSVTIPEGLTSCDVAGKCAIQWYWFADSKQTYISCLDFYMD